MRQGVSSVLVQLSPSPLSLRILRSFRSPLSDDSSASSRQTVDKPSRRQTGVTEEEEVAGKGVKEGRRVSYCGGWGGESYATVVCFGFVFLFLPAAVSCDLASTFMLVDVNLSNRRRGRVRGLEVGRRGLGRRGR